MQDDAAIAEHYRAQNLIRRHQLACRGLERVPRSQAAYSIIKTLRRGYRATEPKVWDAMWF